MRNGRDRKWGERPYNLRGDFTINPEDAAIVRQRVANEPDRDLLLEILGIEE